jgi:tetratricopeptide (TPR) repeat protein
MRRILFLITTILFVLLIVLLITKIPQRMVANYWYTQGLQEFRQGKTNEAEKFFLRALFWNPKHLRSAEYLVLTSVPKSTISKNNQQEILKILERFEYARQLGSSWEPIYTIAASLKLINGNYSEARKLIEEAITRNERNKLILEKFLVNIEKMEDYKNSIDQKQQR